MFSHDIPRDPIVNPADDLPHDPELLGSNIPSGNINRLVVGIRGADVFLQYFTVLNFEKIVHRFIDDDNEFKNYNIV